MDALKSIGEPYEETDSDEERDADEQIRPPKRHKSSVSMSPRNEGSIPSSVTTSKNNSWLWTPTTAAAQIEKTKQQLKDVKDSLCLSVKLSGLKQSLRNKDVFLSHSGIQKNFVRQLYLDLKKKHVSCFFDEDENSLPLAEEFPSLIFEAAKTCRIAVVLLSKEFIRSKWPMQELAAFVEAKKSRENANLILLPIFFKIKPKELKPKELSDITKDSQDWQKLKESDRGKWEDALNAVRPINGLSLGEDENKDVNEVTLRGKVVKEICRRLKGIHPPQLIDFEPVGIEEQVRNVKALLDFEGPQSALAVFVCGFGGVGKSTLAAYVVQSLDWPTDFKFCSVEIDEKRPDKISHIMELQKNILYDLGEGKDRLSKPAEGQSLIKEALKNKCSLLFIDNVVDSGYIRQLLPKFDAEEQNTELNIKCEQKLRILVTARDENVKAELNIKCKVHVVATLSEQDSRCLLQETILQGEVVKDKDFDEKGMINEVADACKGVPLLLSIFGEHLRAERSKYVYEEALDALRKGELDGYRDENLGKTLMFVYNKIRDDELKEAFLDICTYFHGREWDFVADIVDLPKLEDLRRRMLVSRRSGKVIVHDILRLMGMKKAKFTRFSNYKELSDALKNRSEGFVIDKVKGISLLNDYPQLITIESTQLEAMSQSLRVVMLGDWVTLGGPPCRREFTNLRYLSVGDISAFPFEDPSKLNKLRVLVNGSKCGMNLSHLPSSLKRISHQVPDDVEYHKFGELPFQNLNSLKSFIVETEKSVELPEELHLPASLVHLDLNRCKNLPKDMGHLIALESLILDNSDLESLPPGFGKLKKLKHLSMDFCSRLAFLSEELGMLCSLEVLSMKYCENLKSLPENLGGLLSLPKMEFSGRENLRVLPESLGGLTSLQKLEFSGCHNLQKLPESLGELRIQSLDLADLVSLNELPNGFGEMPLLKNLTVSNCRSLKSLPKSFVQLKMLETLKIIQCIELSVLPEDFGRLECLKEMTIKHCDLLQELPESLVELRIQSLDLHALVSLNELPNGFGNMPFLKDLIVSNCDSLKSLPKSFVQLKMLETLKIIKCRKLSVLPEDFGRLECLKEMTVEQCDLLQELPHGFGALTALKTFSLKLCDSFVNLPKDFTELTSLEHLSLEKLPLMSRIPDGFENMASLERLSIENCSELDGAIMEKIVKLPNCYMADIHGSRKLLEKWTQMQGEAEHSIVIVDGSGWLYGINEKERRRIVRVCLLNGKCVEVEKGSGQLMERSSLLVKGTPATLALIMLRQIPLAFSMLPINFQSHQYENLQRCVEKAEEEAPTDGWGKLQIVCFREVDLDGERPTPTEEYIREILQWLPKGSCAIPSSECKRLKILTKCCFSNWSPSPDLFMGNVGVDMELTTWDRISVNVPRCSEPVSEPFHLPFPARTSFSLRFEEAENKTRVLVEELKGKGIHYLLNHHNTSQMMVDDLHGKVIGLINCGWQFSGWLKLKLQQIYKDLQHKDSDFIWIWIPTDCFDGSSHGCYTRLIEWMPWATLPYPWIFDLENRYEICITLLDKDGQITNHDALPLLIGWGIEAYPFTQHTIPESFSLMTSEFLLHGMNIVGRKPMERKMTFLYADYPRGGLEMKSKLEELTQIHGCFEVLYVGKYDREDCEDGTRNVDDIEYYKHPYEAATQNMLWPSLSFWDMISFWYRYMYLKESNMETLHGLAKDLSGNGSHDDRGWLVLVDNGGVVTRRGEHVVQMICEWWREEGMTMRIVKNELMKSLSIGECSPVVRTFFRDEIHNHPRHPQHSISLSWVVSANVDTCGVCGVDLWDEEESSWEEKWEWMFICNECDWSMCQSCGIAYAEQEVEQLLAAQDN